MGKSFATVSLLLLLVIGPALLAPRAAADIAPPEPPGTHVRFHVATVELGAWEGYTSRFVRVKPGDTLGGIAREHLGSFERWKEIAELNGVEPQTLAVNAELRLPPLHTPLPSGAEPDAKRPDARAWWDFFTLPGIGGKLARYETPPKPGWGSGMWLVAIRHDRAAEVVKRVNEDPLGVDAALKALAPTSSDWLARSDVLTRAIRVKDDDPVHRVETHWRVANMEGGRLVLEKVSERVLGRDGRELPASSTPPAADALGAADESAGPPARWDLILTFLALLAAIGIAVVYAQRARRRQAEPASPTSA